MSSESRRRRSAPAVAALALCAPLTAVQAQADGSELDFLLNLPESSTSTEAAVEGAGAGSTPSAADESAASEPNSSNPPADRASATGTTPPAEAYPETIPVAQSEPAPDAVRTPAKSRFIEEIVVTAQKREENLQDVPISVQAFSADLLDAKGIEEPKALQLTTPGLQYNVFAGYSLIYIRGVGTDAFIPSADASVATYIDNVYFPFGHSLASALGSIERVEILKGPQGTLFGRNSTGGAINIITRQPGPDAQANVLVSRENYDKTNIRAYVNIPIVDSLAVSISGLSYSEESYYTLSDLSPRLELPDETSRAFSVKAGWTPIDDLTATLGYSYINSRGRQPMSLTVGEVKPAGALLGVRRQPDYQTGEDGPVYIDTVSRVLTADIQYSLPWFDLRLIGGDQDITSPALADYDGSSQPIATFESLGQFADVRTGEFQILSNDESWGADWLKWIVGAYHIKSSAGYDPLLFSLAPNLLSFLSNPPAGGLFDALAGLTVPLIGGLETISDRVGIPLSTLVNTGVSLSLQGVLDTESTAFFTQVTANLTDRVALTVGGRYQTETRTLAKSTTRVLPNRANPYAVIPALNFGSREADSSNFSPKAVLDFKFDDENMLYLSYNKGFKSGTFNIIAIYAPTQYVEPEEVTSYEFGYKGTLLDGSMRLNAAVFMNQIKNLQVQTISLTSGGAVRFETAGSAEIKGADFDVTWQMFPEAAPGFVFTLGGAWLDGTYTDYKDGSGFDELTGLFFDGTIFPNRDFTGNKIVRTPEFSGNAGLAYSFELGDGTIEVAADAYYNSGSYYSAQNTPSSEEQAYHLFNARASYFYNPWNLRLSVFGKNLNDARYHYVIADLDFGTARLLAPPATYGVKLQWDFR